MNESFINIQKRETMFRSIKDMRGYRIYATDGELGVIEDFLFDDETWVVRHFVVSTKDREVLLSPLSFAGANWDASIMNVNLSLKQIQDSPDIDTHLPISRKVEADYYDFFGWQYYWGGTYTSSGDIYPYQVGLTGIPVRSAKEVDIEPEPDEPTENEVHLRSADEVIGYNVEATDGSIGNVEDFIINDGNFNVQFVVIDTSPWWFGGKVLLPTKRIQTVSWPGRLMNLDATRDEVKASPEWDHLKPVDGVYAESIHEHYK